MIVIRGGVLGKMCCQSNYTREVGTRYAITHGGVADYALVAEGTGFQMVWVEAGKAFFKVTLYGESGVYTPYLQRPIPLEKSPNAIVRMAKLIEAIEEWAIDYERRMTVKTAGGTVTPKINIGAIRGGYPYKIIESAETCSIYLDTRLKPGQDPLLVRRELQLLVSGLGLAGDVDLFLYRPGYEATGVEQLVESIEHAQLDILGSRPAVAHAPISSMWRDTNVFCELGIPTVTYGPGGATGESHLSISVADLLKAAKIYAQVILSICTHKKI